MFYYKEKLMLQKDKTTSQKFQSVYNVYTLQYVKTCTYLLNNS